MGDAVNGTTNKRLPRNVVAGTLVVASALVILVAALRYQAFFPDYIPKAVLCVFPIPLALGLAIGLVSPRKAIAWAPLWSGVFSLLVIAVVSTAITRAPTNPSERILWAAVGALLGTGAGIGGQLLAARALVGKSTIIFVAACIAAGVGGRAILDLRMACFERESVPHILEETDKEIIALSPDMQWQCVRDVGGANYVLKSSLNERPILIYAVPDPAVVDHIEYNSRITCPKVSDLALVHRCLEDAGVREEFLLGLTQEDGGNWISVIRNTQLTIDREGRFRISAAGVLWARSVDIK